ncbi:retron Ec48 family effector membrane protein [Pseudoalteromonas sp. 2CM39R]|uniref:retron Ec48 family effector membrane protein n=1 Tax=Pseudoalteromonas sp. 2CM39R TaxID=2929856 RepID=UPI0020C04EAF|nr:retron Ec48 family effector membrane protein [Pseudoalteromonas sp. 2CM39R]MCK8130083.1 retron Ec48 family effector membrane protein [Pseudoalteromonas sp. 2CM39R]
MKFNLKCDPLKVSKYLIIFHVVITSLAFIFITSVIYIEQSYFNRPFCFTQKCIKTFGLSFKDAFDFLEISLKLLFTSVTIFSIYFALRNYISATTAAKTTIHLTNLNTFKDYLISESKGENALNVKKIDILKWYNIIYPDSRFGELYVSETYKQKLSEINRLIDNSNSCFSGTSEEVSFFDYKQHQTQMINLLKTIGISLPRSPRNSFKDNERSVFSLINKINKEFCGHNNATLIKAQNYR